MFHLSLLNTLVSENRSTLKHGKRGEVQIWTVVQESSVHWIVPVDHLLMSQSRNLYWIQGSMHLKPHDIPFAGAQHIEWFLFVNVLRFVWYFKQRTTVGYTLFFSPPWELTRRPQFSFENWDKILKLRVHRRGRTIIRFFVLLSNAECLSNKVLHWKSSTSNPRLFEF